MMVSGRSIPTCATRARALVLFAGVIAIAALPRPADAQGFVPSSLGFIGGAVAGAHISIGAYILRSRLTGWNFHAVEDIARPRLETMPIILAPISGAVLGAASSERLGAAATWGGVGLVSGALIGATIGHQIWGDSPGRWAGGTIGSAAGLLLGSVLGASLMSSDSDGEANAAARPRYLTFSIPVGGF